MRLLKQLDAWLEWLWDHSPPGKAEARRRERRRLEWKQREVQRAARQARTRVAQSREHLDDSYVAPLEAQLAQLDAAHAALEASWTEEPHIAQSSTDLQQRYHLLERRAKAAVSVALGIRGVEMRIEQVQQAIANLSSRDVAPNDNPQWHRLARSLERGREQLAKIEAHLQRLQKRHKKLEQQPSAAEVTYVQQLEKLANDFEALEQRGLDLWRKLAPKEFEADIAAVRAFAQDVTAIRARLRPGRSRSASTKQRTYDYDSAEQGDIYNGHQGDSDIDASE